MRARLKAGESVSLRPLFVRVAGTAYLSSLLALLPPFVSLYFLTIPSGTWPTVVVTNVIVVVALYVGITQMRSARVTFTPDAIIELGYLGRTVRTPRTDLAKICVAEVYNGRSLDTLTNVFFLDAGGRTRLRLRGQFWGDKNIAAAIDAYELPVDRIPEPMARSELRHRYRQNLYLYERRPSLTYAAGAAALLVVATPLVAALTSAV
ncbi:hypothetical protein [Herbiconiux sp. L3-i23]|uniref:hypothetical protein n=1 Tax=Herbiconiux sp. L3-i23 TaxID=2905871 RepID=UPI00204AFCD5|nr:hypothetical protein [Herbiconiux sp. L3-i23]BDI21504.1 hypothetical protein L3i23_02800 [Herbiconiux sp. L3-i23]